MNEIRQMTGTLTDQQIIDAIVLIDATCPKGDAGANHRLVRANLYETIEARYPWLDEILEAWVEADDDPRDYTQVIIDALTAEYVLVEA